MKTFPLTRSYEVKQQSFVLVLARVHGNNTAISMKTAPSSTIGERSSIYDGTKVSINKYPYMVITVHINI